jgi:hypothetical protein
MINTNDLYTKVREFISNTIGNDLSQIGGKPAIVKARENGARLQFPFATMDILAITDANSYLTNRYLNDQGYVVYETFKHITFELSVRADSQESYELTQRLNKALSFFSSTNLFNEGINASIVATSPITATPDPLADRLQEFNSFILTLGIIDTDVDENSFPVENTDIDGTLNDPSGTSEDINIPTNP